MPFDFAPSDLSPNQHCGLANYHAGMAAEEAVADTYSRRGFEPLARRWRGKAGEIDLIFGQGGDLVFVEVKKGRDFTAAAEHLTPRQIARISAAAEEFAGLSPDHALAGLRIDAALVDDLGRIDILENITL